MSNSDRVGSVGEPAADGERTDGHLAEVGDGCGCVEVWEFLSEHRDSD